MTEPTLNYGNTAPPPHAGGRFSAFALVFSFACWLCLGLWMASSFQQRQPQGVAGPSPNGPLLDAAVILIIGTAASSVAIVALVRTIRRRRGEGFILSLSMSSVATMVGLPLFLLGLFSLAVVLSY